jgi:hypothetical protein
VVRERHALQVADGDAVAAVAEHEQRAVPGGEHAGRQREDFHPRFVAHLREIALPALLERQHQPRFQQIRLGIGAEFLGRQFVRRGGRVSLADPDLGAVAGHGRRLLLRADGAGQQDAGQGAGDDFRVHDMPPNNAARYRRAYRACARRIFHGSSRRRFS